MQTRSLCNSRSAGARLQTRTVRVVRAARQTRLQAFNKAAIEFIRGIEEPSVPDVRLTRSKDGGSGTATFTFAQPSIFEASGELGDITGMYMVDDEGTLSTVDVQAKFVNGKPDRIECKFVMRSAFEWDRFMRFMERYADEKNLGFQGN